MNYPFPSLENGFRASPRSFRRPRRLRKKKTKKRNGEPYNKSTILHVEIITSKWKSSRTDFYFYHVSRSSNSSPSLRSFFFGARVFVLLSPFFLFPAIFLLFRWLGCDSRRRIKSDFTWNAFSGNYFNCIRGFYGVLKCDRFDFATSGSRSYFLRRRRSKLFSSSLRGVVGD